MQNFSYARCLSSLDLPYILVLVVSKTALYAANFVEWVNVMFSVLPLKKITITSQVVNVKCCHNTVLVKLLRNVR